MRLAHITCLFAILNKDGRYILNVLAHNSPTVSHDVLWDEKWVVRNAKIRQFPVLPVEVR